SKHYHFCPLFGHSCLYRKTRQFLEGRLDIHTDRGSYHKDRTVPKIFFALEVSHPSCGLQLNLLSDGISRTNLQEKHFPAPQIRRNISTAEIVRKTKTTPFWHCPKRCNQKI